MDLTQENIKEKTSDNLHEDFLDFLEEKKQGKEHSEKDIHWFVNHLGKIPEYQIVSWLSAVCVNGLNKRETSALTKAMAYSGHVLTLKRHLPEYDPNAPDKVLSHRGFIDKHSTGGVGDKITLVAGPLLAAMGFSVSKLSGRSLGHTGGTIDKLESIPGFRTNLEMKDFEKQVDEIGIALAEQTLEFAPADKTLYRLRDLSGNIDSIPLIASSIMSKKISGGADYIVLDVKYGSGAFMKELGKAKELARTMVNIGKSLNLNTKAIISDMNQPLGNSVGNLLEVIEAKKILAGDLKNDTYELALEIAEAYADNRQEAVEAIESGKAYVKFEEWISSQGGDINAIETSNNPRFKFDYLATEDGYVKELDALKVGRAIHKLGYKLHDGQYHIDHKAGVTFHYKVGDKVSQGDNIFEVQGDDEQAVIQAQQEILDAYLFAKRKTKALKLIYRRFS